MMCQNYEIIDKSPPPFFDYLDIGQVLFRTFLFLSIFAVVLSSIDAEAYDEKRK